MSAENQAPRFRRLQEKLPAGGSGGISERHDDAATSAELRQIADTLLDPANRYEARKQAARRLAQISRALDDTVPAETRRAVGSLSPREREIFAALAEGLTIRDIAARLHRSPKTVNNHRTHVMRKLKLRTTAELTRIAIRLDIVSI